MYHLNNGGRIFPDLCGKGKIVMYKVLQDTKERGELGLPDLKLYFAACCLGWVQECLLLRIKQLLELEGHEI